MGQQNRNSKIQKFIEIMVLSKIKNVGSVLPSVTERVS